MDQKETGKKHLKDQFLNQIASEILDGKLKPGDRLPTERKLAGEAMISRAAVHLAMEELERMGFIRTNARHATYVEDYLKNGNIETLNYLITFSRDRFAKDHMQELLDMRLAIEGRAIELLLEQNDPFEETLKEYLSCARAIAEAEQPEDVQLAGSFFEFHHEICVLSGNFILSMMFNSFRNVTLSYWQDAIRTLGAKKCIDLEAQFLDTLSGRNSEKSIAFLRQEFEFFRDQIEQES